MYVTSQCLQVFSLPTSLSCVAFFYSLLFQQSLLRYHFLSFCFNAFLLEALPSFFCHFPVHTFNTILFLRFAFFLISSLFCSRFTYRVYVTGYNQSVETDFIISLSPCHFFSVLSSMFQNTKLFSTSSTILILSQNTHTEHFSCCDDVLNFP